jgi:hypothetical protein
LSAFQHAPSLRSAACQHVSTHQLALSLISQFNKKLKC